MFKFLTHYLDLTVYENKKFCFKYKWIEKPDNPDVITIDLEKVILYIALFVTVL